MGSYTQANTIFSQPHSAISQPPTAQSTTNNATVFAQFQPMPPSYQNRPISLTAAQNPVVEQLPPTRQLIRVPLEPGVSRDDIQFSSSRDRISLTTRDVPLNVVLALIAEQHGLNVVTGADVTERITIKLTDTPLYDALDVILSVNDYTWTRQKNILVVSKVSADKKSSAGLQGRQVRVFNLNYVTSTDVDRVVKGLLSPVGQSFTNQTLATDRRRTHEQLVVEDLPTYIQRIETYLRQADTPPRQVLIEAHVLQVALKGDLRHGVNLQEVARLANSNITIGTAGLATGLPPTASLKIDGSKLTGLLDCIKSTTDAKTLASPKVAVLNNQEANMQVGSKIGYLLTTTTQTSTLQSVNFLDLGVILNVTPSITEDGQVLIQVKPQVSTGRINTSTQLPESETTEVNTQVLLADGEAIVIGGLIKETDVDGQNKIPFLGDLWLVGWMFQRREIKRERNEIIITLLPRIIPNAPGCRSLNPVEVQQAQTPLLHGPLYPVDRTEFEPKLPCYTDRPRLRPFFLPTEQPSVSEILPAEEIHVVPEMTSPETQQTGKPKNIKASVEPASYQEPSNVIQRLPAPDER